MNYGKLTIAILALGAGSAFALNAADAPGLWAYAGLLWVFAFYMAGRARQTW